MTYRKELWEKQFKPYDRQRRQYEAKRITKSQLVEIFKEKELSMSPKINTILREGADDVALNTPYEITNVEDITTEAQGYKGYRVELLSPKADIGSVMLWQRPITSPDSKLGSFITALGDNTDKWLGKWIIFKGWEIKNRTIEVISQPALTGKKAAPRLVRDAVKAGASKIPVEKTK